MKCCLWQTPRFSNFASQHYIHRMKYHVGFSGTGSKYNEFSKSREVLAAKRKNLVRQGKGNHPNATRELTEAEEDALFENGQSSVQDPKSLQRAL